jgi:hypothetical protein
MLALTDRLSLALVIPASPRGLSRVLAQPDSAYYSSPVADGREVYLSRGLIARQTRTYGYALGFSPAPSIPLSTNQLCRLSSKVRSRLNAALIKAIWVKAWGKLPSASPLPPISSAYNPK